MQHRFKIGEGGAWTHVSVGVTTTMNSIAGSAFASVSSEDGQRIDAWLRH